MLFCASSLWTRAASSSEDKEFSFSLRAVSTFWMATSFSSRALPFSRRVPESVMTVTSFWRSSVSFYSSTVLRYCSSAVCSSTSRAFRCDPLDVMLVGNPR